MTTGRPARAAGLLAAAAVAAAGCVERRFIVESNVPGAQVYVDNRPIGAAPAHTPFDYYGYYTFTLVHPDYEPLTRRVHVVAPWYAYPPFDFVAEALWPFHIQDNRRYYFEMCPAQQPRTDDLIRAADELRARGLQLPGDPPKPRPAAAPGGPAGQPPAGQPPAGQPPAGLPPPATLPPPSPLAPGVEPAGYRPPAYGTTLR